MISVKNLFIFWIHSFTSIFHIKNTDALRKAYYYKTIFLQTARYATEYQRSSDMDPGDTCCKARHCERGKSSMERFQIKNLALISEGFHTEMVKKPIKKILRKGEFNSRSEVISWFEMLPIFFSMSNK